MAAIMSSDSGKAYIDRGVQTSPQPSVPASGPLVTSSSGLIGDLLLSNLSLDSEYTDPCDNNQSFLSKNISPARATTIACRSQRNKHLPYSRPLNGKHSSNRVVSLPEATAERTTQTSLELSTRRLVSMPERQKSSVSVFNDYYGFESSASTDNSLFSEENAGPRIHAPPLNSDLPHTPSPPSSPDSILIIENRANLPDIFLRRMTAEETPAAYPEDEGWISWASSPPRPIPALHGPLSLPYARCPSGAEGTIIEESDNLPRMIWGLGADDIPPNHSRNDLYTSHNGIRQKHAHQMQPNFPPRLQKMHDQGSRFDDMTVNDMNLESQSHVKLESDKNVKASLQRRALETLGTRHPRENRLPSASLERVLLPRNTFLDTTRTYHGRNSHTQDGILEDIRPMDMDGELFLDWQSALLQQTLRNSILEPNPSERGELADSLRPSAPSFIPTKQPTQQYPRIFVEPRLSETPKYPAQSNRMSAIELAHQYRQRQQLHSVLPTPPSSSSPQWSSKFSPYSPYQESLFVSEAMAACVPQPLPTSSILQQQTARATEASNNLRKYVSERMGGGTRTSSASNISQFSPSLSYRSELPERRKQHLDISAFSELVQRRDNIPSPCRVLRPSLKGPLSSVSPAPSPRHIQQNSDHSPSLGSPSPSSPEARSRTLSYQQPRSVPLARLIQRRLSSVPEEDFNTFLERGLTSSPSQRGLVSVGRSPAGRDRNVPFTTPQRQERRQQHTPTPKRTARMSYQGKAEDLMVDDVPATGSKEAPQVKVKLHKTEGRNERKFRGSKEEKKENTESDMPKGPIPKRRKNKKHRLANSTPANTPVKEVLLVST